MAGGDGLAETKRSLGVHGVAGVAGEQTSEKRLGSRARGSSSSEPENGLEVERTYEYGYADAAMCPRWR